ncbi:DUF2167 domain-containing protein [Puniceicoccus vermicola]|uniref:DUF2167 domain-containing protein n=1 Tax=Puniceicoccus vermicola TaxID=388746 RepID=A0A7X1B193_9BACT|nr:DUF2167 domain-containing protein [Puniceicoccus vermicola]MBC2603702.1 DUF2167 domain-containing protein [Puniceicoccus vermicola]
MKKPLLSVAILCLSALSAFSQEIEWIEGPATASIGDIAEINVPEGYVFTGADGTKRLMEAMQNPVSNTELGFLAPASVFEGGEDSWYVVFEFDSIGYVKDDQKDDLDADAILKSIRAANQEANKMRVARGWPELHVVGWAVRPNYNPQTNNLEWATRVSANDGEDSINYNTRLLGRKGVMAVTLVTGVDAFSGVKTSYEQSLAGFSFVKGERYAEWKSGDKIAQYGLTGLVVGGGAAIAAKTGLLAKFWKILIIPFLAIGAFIKKIFKR